MMKNIVIVVIVMLLMNTVGYAQQKVVKLIGKLKHFDNQVQVEDMSEFQYLNVPTEERMIVPDSTGNFSITLKIASPNYFRLGRNILYLTPGDSLYAIVDYNYQTKSTFSGRGADANNYLSNTPFPKAGSFVKGGSNIKTTPHETLQVIMAEAAERKQQLGSTINVSEEFKRLETARIKADVINSIQSVETYVLYVNAGKKIDSPKKYLRTFYDLADSIKNAYRKNFIDASFLKLVVYRDIADSLVAKAPLNADVRKIKDWYAAYDIVSTLNEVNDKPKLAAYTKQIDSIKTTAYKQALARYLKELLKFGKGDLAVDFNAIDTSGKKIALSDLKGKVIYIDIWATWCGPCIAELPHLQEVKTMYKNNDGIVFVSLSIDDDKEIPLWKANVARRKLDGWQWHINRESLRAYNIVRIPRTLLIDKSFKIVRMNAPLPSEKELKATIDGVLN